MGYATVKDEAKGVNTGVTAILPRGRNMSPCAAGLYVLNGNGDMTVGMIISLHALINSQYKPLKTF